MSILARSIPAQNPGSRSAIRPTAVPGPSSSLLQLLRNETNTDQAMADVRISSAESLGRLLHNSRETDGLRARSRVAGSPLRVGSERRLRQTGGLLATAAGAPAPLRTRSSRCIGARPGRADRAGAKP